MAELTGKTILLVDDDAEVRQAIEAALEPLGSTILLADDGNVAVELAAEKSPDLVILDMMLPKRSGFLVLEKIKRGKKKGVCQVDFNCSVAQRGPGNQKKRV